MLKSWLFAIFVSSIKYTLFVPPPPSPHKVFHNFCFFFYFYRVFSVVPREIEDNYAKFGGEGANKIYYEVQIANKSEVSELELSLSTRC